ncbi:MAG: SDR family NAD(P)-dependent oxidoreductase [Chitinophagia bacterium]|jgi:short-subunit dehydrogenase|nr:SDR family NAD(P)-dependent oxidoreductase [Chitinophagia bacterium]
MLALSVTYPQKRAFITGAASGLGKAFCMDLARDGWTIGMADNNVVALEVAAADITAAGGNPLLFPLDVADKDQYQQVATDFLNQTGGIDLLFNNAGVGDGSVFEEYSLENYEWMVSINQMGVLYGCYYFVPAMKKQRSGHIINTASAAAIGCAPTMAAYNITKAAVLALSETLYGELMDYQVHVSCIMPTYFKTNVIQHARGGELVKKATQHFINRSGLEAPEVAAEILARAGKKELYIILPKSARKMWWMKRLAPTRFRKMVKEQFMASMQKVKKYHSDKK